MHTLFFLRSATSPSGPGPPHYRGFTITLKYVTFGRTPLDECSARHRDLYLTTHNTHKGIDICAWSRIRTRNPSKWAAAALRLRPRSRWDWSYVQTDLWTEI